MSGTNLQFKGFIASNQGIDNPLTVFTNVGTNNIVYDLDPSLIQLSELSSGVPTADELVDITYPSGLPSNGDLLQWNNSSSTFLPVSPLSLGINTFKTILASSQFKVTSGTAFAADSFLSTPTDFSIGGNYDSGNPLINPAGWDEKNWSVPYNILINNTAGSLSSIDSNNLSTLITVPYNLTIGQKIKLTSIIRLEKGTGVAGRFRQAILYVDQNNFLDTTGNETTIEMLESNRFVPTLTDSTLNIYNINIEHTLTKDISAGDFLVVGFGNLNFNNASTDFLSVNWSLSCSDS